MSLKKNVAGLLDKIPSVTKMSNTRLRNLKHTNSLFDFVADQHNCLPQSLKDNTVSGRFDIFVCHPVPFLPLND